jgi:hypothetical protein
MKAIAYIKSDQADQQDPSGSIFEKQKKSVAIYCHENDLELLQIFEEDQNSTDAGAASWNQMEGYLKSQHHQIDILIVNSLDHLGYNPQVLSDKLSYLSTLFKITVVCLTDQFIGNVVKDLNELEDVHSLKKEIAELLLLYLLTFQSKVVNFTVQELAKFRSKDTALFMQPCDTFQNPFNLDGLSTITESDNFHFDCNVYLSLLESTLLLLLSRSILRSQTVVSPNAGKAIITKGYTILSEVLKLDNDEEFFATGFTVTFSNDFWADLKLNS